MLLYSFYWVNKDKYKIAFDLGANIGIDSIVLGKFGYDVYAFEPDPDLFAVCENNIKLNHCGQVHPFQKAISDKRGTVDFVRVKGNTTANHIAGARGYYGDVERIAIETQTFADIGIIPDLMKINVEGFEKIIVPTIPHGTWMKMDVFIEVHDEENARAIFDYFRDSALHIFSQKIGWARVNDLAEMPFTNKEGYIFISAKKDMPWGA